jgi:type I restriction-modification system DNA methylase subunit
LQQQSLGANIPFQAKQQSLLQEENITKKLYADYSVFKQKLFQNITEQNPQLDKLLLFKKTQKLLDRFLFILFAEDRLLLPPNSVREILKQWEQLKELDNYVPLYDRFKKYFGYLNVGHTGKHYEIFAYNGGLFSPDEILESIAIDDTILHDGTKTLSNYDFETDVDVNILGHIFEHSLTEIEELQAQLDGKALEKKTTKRKKDGVFYTPRYITKYIVENTVGALCTQKKEELNINEESFAPQKRKANRKALFDVIETYRNWLLQLTICDPACGSGAFLNAALEYLKAEHRTADELTARIFGDAIVYTDLDNSILENNLYGVDINEDAIEIAKLSLWLRTARKGRKLSNLSNNIKCGLIDDAAVAGDKAFVWKDEFKTVFDKGGFDVVIGNPPYVTGSLLDDEKDWYRKNYKTAQYQIDLYILFIEKTLQILTHKGLVSLITPNSWLKNLMMSECRKILLDKTCLLKIIPNLPNVFENVSVDSLIFSLTTNKNIHQEIEIIELRKTESYIKHRIDQNLFYKNSGYIFTVEINKSLQELISKIKDNTIEIDKLFDITRGINPYDIYTGQAKEIIESKAYHSKYKKDETFVPELRGRHVGRYNYSWDNEHFISYGDWLAAPRDKKYFTGKRILFREILGENFVCTYIDADFKVDRSLYSTSQ